MARSDTRWSLFWEWVASWPEAKPADKRLAEALAAASRLPVGPCLSDSEKADVVSGKMDEGWWKERGDAHLAACPNCANDLAALFGDD